MSAGRWFAGLLTSEIHELDGTCSIFLLGLNYRLLGCWKWGRGRQLGVRAELEPCSYFSPFRKNFKLSKDRSILGIRHQCSSWPSNLVTEAFPSPAPLSPLPPPFQQLLIRTACRMQPAPSCTMSFAFCRRCPLWSLRMVADCSQEPFPLKGMALTAMSPRY